MLKAKELYQKIKGTRRHKTIGVVLTFALPVFFVLVIEFAQKQSVSILLEFVLKRTTVFIFDVLFIGLVYAGLLFLLKRAWIASIPIFVFFYLAALAEFFKYKSSGIHFDIADVVMIKDMSQLTKFGGVAINGRIVATFLVIFLYIFALFWFRAKISFKRKCSLIVGALLVCAVFSIVATPVGKPVYSFMGVNTETVSNPIEGEIKFRENSFLALLIESISTKITGNTGKYIPPEDVEGAVKSVLLPGTEATSDIQPNIIVIMCESFSDFRTLFKDVPDSYYTNFDSFRKAGNSFTNIVPAFGGSTIRTEFELLLGIPMMSLPDVSLPQFALKSRESQLTIASQLKSKGYYSTYIHPYHRDFYSRDTIYSQFEFDEMMFLDVLEDREKIGWFVSDAAVGGIIADKIRTEDKPLYIHATTMQNHQPYNFDAELSEYEYYLKILSETNRGLGQLKAQLDTITEPTIVLFTGDHLPNFVEKDQESLQRSGRTFYNPFSDAGLDAATAHKIYREEAFVWNNYGADLSAFSGDISSFYLPHMLIEAAGVGLSPFSNTVLNVKKTVPIYSSNYKNKIKRNDILDLLTYDIVYGDCFSGR